MFSSPLWADSWVGPGVSGLHGSAGVWAQTRPDHHAETCWHPGSTEEADEGKEKKWWLTGVHPKHIGKKNTFIYNICSLTGFNFSRLLLVILKHFCCYFVLVNKGHQQHDILLRENVKYSFKLWFLMCPCVSSKSVNWGFTYPTPSTLPDLMPTTQMAALHHGSCE